ncbi:MAG: 4-hydroxybenzoate octaprenyltransferase [Nitrospirae bacterium]|nr:MAG: 4-hydroxybenzoate octaprenyltransferase [Nitrospirota bacterium]
MVVAMVGARSAAMGTNRLVDRHIDALNPRTRDRELVRGEISVAATRLFVVAAIALFELACWRLNRLCLLLSPVALAVLLGYSYTKRFTACSHLVLGLALGLAPLGAWIAVTGGVDPRILVLCAGVLLWVAGFDTIYALQDVEFDRRAGLHSLPARLGVSRALWLARLFHLAAFACFAAVERAFHLGPLYDLGLLVVAGLMVYEHTLVRGGRLVHIERAFFTLNGYISVCLFAFTVLDLAR